MELTSLLLSIGEIISTFYLKEQKDAEIALQDTAIFQNGGLSPSFTLVLIAEAASMSVLLVEKEGDALTDRTRIHQDGGRVLG